MNHHVSSEYDVQVGRVLGPHALRGMVRVLPLTDVTDRHRTLKQVLARTARTEQLLTIAQAQPAKKNLWLVRFEGVEDRTAAEKLKGAELFIRTEDLPPLPEGRYYIHQVVGLRVLTVDGRELGPVTDVLPTGANDVYVTPAGLLPATDEVIKAIDLEAGTMLVDPLPGMIDEPADAD
jgi:16S rRNA processing protein RimM